MLPVIVLGAYLRIGKLNLNNEEPLNLSVDSADLAKNQELNSSFLIGCLSVMRLGISFEIVNSGVSVFRYSGALFICLSIVQMHFTVISDIGFKGRV